MLLDGTSIMGTTEDVLVNLLGQTEDAVYKLFQEAAGFELGEGLIRRNCASYLLATTAVLCRGKLSIEAFAGFSWLNKKIGGTGLIEVPLLPQRRGTPNGIPKARLGPEAKHLAWVAVFACDEDDFPSNSSASISIQIGELRGS